DIVAKLEQDHLALSFIDRGIGIPEEDLPHIFEKFYRVRSTTESGIVGSGLGLTLAKQAAEAHGGTIEVQSQLGKGSTFTVILPLPRSEESEHDRD
ncbi:MAG TPA: ATP-binding protein, partial [Anaerolineae bacterium]|nr:ATP-binding protein [Anaerolineae bacterium]